MLQQARNHQEGLHLNRGLPGLCGDGLWCGIDLACYPSGVLDTLRLPKFSYYFFQSQRDPNHLIPGIDSGPMVFIANTWTAASPTDVRVFSNCQQVRLYVNDVLKETRTLDAGYPTANLLHPPFTFTGCTYQQGELRAEGWIGGQLMASHIVRTPGSAQSLSVRFDATDVPANGSETVFVYASVVDARGTVVPDASDKVTFAVQGPATLASPVSVNAEAGIATALVRVSDQPGQITVTVTAPGMEGGHASITCE
jgi:beta-galactosidase